MTSAIASEPHALASGAVRDGVGPSARRRWAQCALASGALPISTSVARENPAPPKPVASVIGSQGPTLSSLSTSSDNDHERLADANGLIASNEIITDISDDTWLIALNHKLVIP